MKNTYRLLLLTSLFAACVSDDSNESLNLLNKATITGIEDSYDNVYVDDRLIIKANVTTAFNDDSEYEYYWIAYDKNTYNKADTLSHSKILDIIVSLTPGEHTLKFKAVDTATGIFYEKASKLNIVNEFTNGLLILGDNKGVAQLHFWEPAKDRVITDVYAKFNNGEIIGTNPVRVYFNKYTNDEASEVLVLCQDGKGGKIINSVLMTKMREYEDFFLSRPESIHPEAYFKCNMREYIIDNGLAYDRATNSFTPSATVKPNLSVQGKTYHIAGNANLGDDANLPSRMVFYDNANGCFYTLQSITTAFLTLASKTTGLTYVNGGYFNPDNVGMTCLYANISARSETGAREYMGIFKTPQGECRLLRFGIGFWVDDATPSTYFKDLGNDIITDITLANASSYACSASFSGYMFYANGNSLYVYNSISMTSKLLYSFDETIDINHIELENKGNRLWMAYQDNPQSSMKGGFAVFTISTDGGMNVSLLTRHDGIADKIVDFEQKY